jgi:hypothetical protein
VLKDKVRDINTKYFDKVREFDKLEQENKELQRSLKNLSAKQTTGIMVQEDGKSDSKHWSNVSHPGPFTYSSIIVWLRVCGLMHNNYGFSNNQLTLTYSTPQGNCLKN